MNVLIVRTDHVSEMLLTLPVADAINITATKLCAACRPPPENSEWS